MADATPSITHRGGCHCGAVRWNFRAPPTLTAVACDCSIDRLRAGPFVIVPQGAFELGKGSKEALTEYRFNTEKAMHLFCSRCGVTSFYRPRSNPDCVSVLAPAIDPGTVASVSVSEFKGSDWEASFAAGGAPKPCGGGG